MSAAESEEIVYLTSRKGRSSGKLHTDPNCWALCRSDESFHMARPRSEFDDGREFCRVCTRGGDA